PGSVSRQRHTEEVLHIIYADDQDILFNGASYNLEELGPALRDEFVHEGQVVRLSADESTPLQNVISVMDVIRGAGFERIFIATEPVRETQ
ncbi:MAG: ExbD/TolR family protein, partial [Candidatus Syntrophosphaera sp.]